MNFEELKRLTQTNLSQFDGNEQNVKYNLVLRFLNAFGYDKLDLQQEINQIKSKKIPEKEDLFKKHFIPTVITPATEEIVTIRTDKPVINQPISTDNNKTYKIDSPKEGVRAFGKYYDTKRFIVLKGSTVSNELDESFGKGAADGAYELRKDLERTGIINSNREFTENYTFNSISQAACVVLGGSRSGPREWK